MHGVFPEGKERLSSPHGDQHPLSVDDAAIGEDGTLSPRAGPTCPGMNNGAQSTIAHAAQTLRRRSYFAVRRTQSPNSGETAVATAAPSMSVRLISPTTARRSSTVFETCSPA
jgi:hypothetical protein